ncbi:MAG: D-2-hydroxyacid dehydrogenase family protein [Nitriliruptorales bacterium]|nr:D-2-hydroxyacid dehydrogenase family protein [Nitriliruptorales bacterium]
MDDTVNGANELDPGASSSDAPPAERPAVAVLDDYQGVALDSADWASLPVDVRAFRDHIDDEDEVARRLAPFDIVVAMRERTAFPATLLRRLPRLRLLVTTGPRNAAIDVAAASGRGITVCGTESLASPTVELTWALLLALVRHVPEEDARIRRGEWQSALGFGLDGSVLGLLGLGRIGERVARVASAFGMETIAWSQKLTPARARAAEAKAVTNDELFTRADVVSVHLRLSERTRGLVGQHELGLMKPSAYIVNTSRAEIIDQVALRAALEQSHIAHEPLAADDPARRLPNTVLTPHLGYVTRQQYGVFFGQALEDIRAYLMGTPVRVIEP